jgi:lipoate-protein ligase A
MSGIAVWRDGPADGATNMAADECLAAEAVRRGELVIRLYRWEKTTVSLGAFQPIAAARDCAAIGGVPLVRRPSGGGAIVHGSDFTYAAAVPKRHVWGASPQVFYDAFHTAMVATLRALGVETRLGEADPAAEERFFCFDRRAGGDLIATQPASGDESPTSKLMGSAQRRLAEAVLQHGSLLLTPNPDVGRAARHRGLADLAAAVELGVDGWPVWTEAWLERLAVALGEPLNPQPGSFLETDPPGLAAGRERLASQRWTCRR